VLSGAMDIIAVRYPDGSYKISPFRIRYGAIKIFKAKEKVVNVLVNGEKCEITMRLSESGEAYFQQEIKRVIHNNDAVLSDGYASPVDIGQSAPTSPANKLVPSELDTTIQTSILQIPTLELEPNDKLEKIGNLVIDQNYTQNVNKEYISMNTPTNLQIINETTNTTIDVNPNMIVNVDTEITNSNPQIILDPIDIRDRKVSEISVDLLSSNLASKNDEQSFFNKTSRKMSYDVMSRDEKYYKFRMCRVNEFTINQTLPSKLSTGGLNIELSNSWSMISNKANINLEDVFKQNKITKEEFYKDPWKVLNSTNLAIRFEDHIYTWKVIAPMIMSLLAYKEELPKEVMAQLTQQQQGFFLWKKVNMDAYKIDLKKQIINTPVKSNETISTKSQSPILEIEKPMVVRRNSIQYKKSYTLSSEQIKSLNLKPGKNTISFVVSSRYQGTHTLSTDIYLWEYDDKIVISDLDGTITRSDVLGHVFPWFGKDWSHKGVVKLYNDIYKNGYKILYLTARALVQSSQTKDYLARLTQGNFYIFKKTF
jgi:phosphatidate phosphatase PAH1